MHSLSELDASFLALESSRSPLHVGGVYVFKKLPRSRFSFGRFRSLLESKLGNEAFFRKRLVEHKLSLELPLWVDDADFELDNHVRCITLNQMEPPPSLLDYASAFFSEALDRSRPLWQAQYIDGLGKPYDKSCFAVLFKVHVSAIDGATGEDILSQLLHVSPEIEELQELEPWNPEAMPNNSNWLGLALNSAINIPSKLAAMAKDTASSALYSSVFESLQRLNLPPALLRVARTPINTTITSRRRIEHIAVPLTKVRAIRRQLPHVTTNDILMGVCAEALSNFVNEHAETLPRMPLVALGPISVRSTSLNYKSGTQLAAKLFSLATTEPDPICRIQLIHEAAKSSDSYKSAISASRLSELVPSCVAALSARAYSEFLLTQKYKPMFNLPITNIPGPQFPLYLEDSELHTFVSASPLFDGIGLALMIVSYNGNYHISSTYCPDILAHEFSFNTYIEGAFETILQLAEQHQFSKPKADDSKAASGLIEDIMGLFNDILSLGPKKSAKQTVESKEE